MNDLIIEGTKKTAEVRFQKDGLLIIRGRSIPEDPVRFFSQLQEWLDEYSKNPAQKTILHIEFEYFNSGTSKALLSILKAVIDLKQNGHDVVIRWCYESGDDDIYERGGYYASLFETEFEFVEINIEN